MKNLPDKFPIRYALIVKNTEEDELENLGLDSPFQSTDPSSESLFRQLILYLQKNPITKDALSAQCINIKFDILGVNIINISRMLESSNENPLEWIEELKKTIKNIIPESNSSGWKYWKAFELGLYSYSGVYELPAFIRAYNAKKEKEKKEKEKQDKKQKEKEEEEEEEEKKKEESPKDNFSYAKRIKFFYDTYTAMRENKLNDWKLYELLNAYEKPIFISSYYSNLWKALDSGKLDGIIPPTNHFVACNKELKKIVDKKYNDKITIAVCKNWESLFAEEIRALYKMFSFCNNCDKPLPFNHRGSYCPDTKENKECFKERSRVRSRKRNITKEKTKL